LDTSTCIAYLRDTDAAHPVVTARIGATPPDELRVSVITIMELTEGLWHDHADAQRYHANRSALHQFLAGIQRVDIGPLVIEEFGRLRALLRSQGQMIGDMDLAIAATALAHRFTVVSNNVKHFGRVPGISLDNWHV